MSGLGGGTGAGTHGCTARCATSRRIGDGSTSTPGGAPSELEAGKYAANEAIHRASLLHVRRRCLGRLLLGVRAVLLLAAMRPRAFPRVPPPRVCGGHGGGSGSSSSSGSGSGSSSSSASASRSDTSASIRMIMLLRQGCTWGMGHRGGRVERGDGELCGCQRAGSPGDERCGCQHAGSQRGERRGCIYIYIYIYCFLAI